MARIQVEQGNVPEASVKIARVITRLNVGGPSVHVILATDMLKTFGFSTVLIAGSLAAGETGVENLEREKNVKPILIPEMSRDLSPLRDLRALWKLVRLLRREKPLILHTHTSKAGALARIASLAAGIPIRVHTYHGNVFSEHFSPFHSHLYIIIERLLAHFTHRLIALSPSQKVELSHRHRIANSSKVACIALGFETAPFLNNGTRAGFLRTQLGLTAQHQLVGWVGRLAPIKDPCLFVQIARQIHVRFPESNFVVAGDGELRPHLEKDVKLAELENCFHVLGWWKNLPQLYSDLDVVVLTSKNEGTPLALLESMASGKAFIAPDVGGIRDLMLGKPRAEQGIEIFENGILVPRAPEFFVGSLTWLFQRPEQLTAMGCKGREFVTRYFSVERLAQDLSQLYRQLLQETDQGSRAAVRCEFPSSELESRWPAASTGYREIEVSSAQQQNVPRQSPFDPHL